MPTVFSHAVVAAALSAGLPRRAGTTDPSRPSTVRRRWIVALGAFCAVLPDADVIAFAFGIPYEHPLGHRGLSHSLAFAAVVATVVVGTVFRRAAARGALWLYVFAATASHGLLDMLTDGGKGVALLGPFSNERLFFPWRPIEVSPIGVERFLSRRGLDVVTNELLWIWAPALVVAGVLMAARLGFERRNVRTDW